MPVIVGSYTAITPERALAIEAATEAELHRRAVSQRATKSAQDTVIRDLLPTDLNNATDQWDDYCSTGWGRLYSGELTDKKLVAIYAVNQWRTAGEYAASFIAAVRFKLGAGGATTKDYWTIEGKDYPVFGKAPIVYDKKDTFNVDAIASGSGEGIIFIGKVAEPVGESIAPG